jgi:hypothetical protein
MGHAHCRIVHFSAGFNIPNPWSALKKAMRPRPRSGPSLDSRLFHLFPAPAPSLPPFSLAIASPLSRLVLSIFDAVRRDAVQQRRGLHWPADIRISRSVLLSAAAAPADSATILGPAAATTVHRDALRRDRSVPPAVALCRSLGPAGRAVPTARLSPSADAHATSW